MQEHIIYKHFYTNDTRPYILFYYFFLSLNIFWTSFYKNTERDLFHSFQQLNRISFYQSTMIYLTILLLMTIQVVSNFCYYKQHFRLNVHLCTHGDIYIYTHKCIYDKLLEMACLCQQEYNILKFNRYYQTAFLKNNADLHVHEHCLRVCYLTHWKHQAL